MQPGDLYFLPQRGYLSSLFLPDAKHMPPDAALRALSFSFPGVAPLATAYQSIQITPAFNAWALGAVDSLNGAQGFQVQIWHLSINGQRQLFRISSSSLLLASKGPGMPMFLPETELFLAGDSIRVQVKNLSTTAADSIWLAVWGGDVPNS